MALAPSPPFGRAMRLPALDAAERLYKNGLAPEIDAMAERRFIGIA
ncbi:hypothetical protein [Azospirillum doebereinerae]|nr:hypothetical protein [Azospirillum doebereinerae]